MERNTKKENLVYLGIWVLLLLTPIISIMVRRAGNAQIEFSWEEVLLSWKVFVPYLIVFLIHNYFVAPLLIYKKKSLLYAAFTLCLVAVVQTYECSHHPKIGPKPIRFEMAKGRPSDMPPPPEISRSHDGPPPEVRPGHDHPPFFFGQHDIISIIIMLLMIGMNLGVKHYFKSKQDAKILEELEKKNLEQQLEYLKYQINPHFFMNTLNNIHALVDIEPEEAKHSILELSKMMRYVLYESNQPKISLEKEVQFLDNYMELMRLRFTDKMHITTSFPEQIPPVQIPPLLFISFIENAFKHGVSYQKDSFVDVALKVDDGRITFNCMNSDQGLSDQQHQGIGLENIKKRLQLLFNDDYTLSIISNSDKFIVTLIIPT